MVKCVSEPQSRGYGTGPELTVASRRAFATVVRTGSILRPVWIQNVSVVVMFDCGNVFTHGGIDTPVPVVGTFNEKVGPYRVGFAWAATAVTNLRLTNAVLERGLGL